MRDGERRGLVIREEGFRSARETAVECYSHGEDRREG